MTEKGKQMILKLTTDKYRASFSINLLEKEVEVTRSTTTSDKTTRMSYPEFGDFMSGLIKTGYVLSKEDMS